MAPDSRARLTSSIATTALAINFFDSAAVSTTKARTVPSLHRNSEAYLPVAGSIGTSSGRVKPIRALSPWLFSAQVKCGIIRYRGCARTPYPGADVFQKGVSCYLLQDSCERPPTKDRTGS